MGEVVYVPIYSRIFHQSDQRTFQLTNTLSVHNVNIDKTIRLRAVLFYDMQGQLLRSFLDKERVLAPLETINFVVEQNDQSGGPGANFLVEWVADETVTNPLIESIMISTSGNQGISFTSTGKTAKMFGHFYKTMPDSN
jgi:hypothetical protein